MYMSAIFTTPIAVVAYPVLKTRKSQEPGKLFARRLEFWGDFHCRKSVSWNICRRNQRVTKGCNWVRARTRDEGDPAFVDGGIEATLNNLSKWLMSASFVAIVIWRHDAEAVWALMGTVLNDKLSLALKQILNQERPNSTLRSDPGMPSSHAQTITYMTIFIILSIVEWYGMNVLTTSLGGLLIVLGSYFTWLRVSQNLHTISQVVVGAIIGSSFSFLWLWSWKTCVLNLFVSILWVRVLIIVATTGFVLNHLSYTDRSINNDS